MGPNTSKTRDPQQDHTYRRSTTRPATPARETTSQTASPGPAQATPAAEATQGRWRIQTSQASQAGQAHNQEQIGWDLGTIGLYPCPDTWGSHRPRPACRVWVGGLGAVGLGNTEISDEYAHVLPDCHVTVRLCDKAGPRVIFRTRLHPRPSEPDSRTNQCSRLLKMTAGWPGLARSGSGGDLSGRLLAGAPRRELG